MEYILCYEQKRNNKEYNIGSIMGGDMPLLNESNSIADLTFDRTKVTFGFNGYFKKGTYGKIELIDDININNGMSDTNFTLRGKFK
ncbi:hypothetical protein JIY74_32555 [Vibrio harveyi]|nr:hypothetical protein [Vibrio harveyi]